MNLLQWSFHKVCWCNYSLIEWTPQHFRHLLLVFITIINKSRFGYSVYTQWSFLKVCWYIVMNVTLHLCVHLKLVIIVNYWVKRVWVAIVCTCVIVYSFGNPFRNILLDNPFWSIENSSNSHFPLVKGEPYSRWRTCVPLGAVRHLPTSQHWSTRFVTEITKT